MTQRKCIEFGSQTSWVLDPSFPCGSCNFSRIDLGGREGTKQSIWFFLIGSRNFVGISFVT